MNVDVFTVDTRVRRNPPRRTFSVTEYEENQLNNGHDKAVAYNDSDSSGNEKLMPSERPSNTAPTDVGVNLHELGIFNMGKCIYFFLFLY